MKKLFVPAVAALMLGNMSTTIAAGDFDRQIKARQSVMQLYAFNLGILGAMAKGEAEYNAEQASTAAANLETLVNMNNGAMWPQGSDATANPGKTRAKLENWTSYPKAAEFGMALKEAAAKMSGEAGNGLEALQAAIGPVGKSCGGCHESFRVPKS